jgi:tetratricopeptide (TPR) repeat protein
MGLNKSKVGKEVGALALLSLVELNDLGPEELTVTRPKFKKPRPPTQPAPEANNVEAKPTPEPPAQRTREVKPVGSPPNILAFLLADLKRLKGQDNFTILGISPKCTQAIAEEAGSRNINRYQEILRGDISTEIRVAAQQMLTIVTSAAATVAMARQGVSSQHDAVDMSNMTTEERAFLQGKKAFANRDYSLARKCFKRARDERLDSVDNLSWLGWAVYHDTEIEKEDRVKEAFDMLRLASSFNPHHEDGQYFLAYVEGHHGLMKQALQRLVGLLGDNPNHESAKNLAREYRGMLKK